MINRLLIALLFLIFISCKKDVNTEKPILPSREEKKQDTLSVVNSSEYGKEVESFSMIYTYSGEDSKQVIGITKLKSNSIKFHLYTNTLPCDTEYWGIATDWHAEMDPETDEDESGLYPSREYVSEKDEYILSIRVAVDLSKVVIQYTQKDSLETDCLPIIDEIMNRNK